MKLSPEDIQTIVGRSVRVTEVVADAFEQITGVELDGDAYNAVGDTMTDAVADAVEKAAAKLP